MQRKLDSEPLRTRIYIDGYNFYYGCLRGTPYKWLDLLPLFEGISCLPYWSRTAMARSGHRGS